MRHAAYGFYFIAALSGSANATEYKRLRERKYGTTSPDPSATIPTHPAPVGPFKSKDTDPFFPNHPVTKNDIKVGGIEEIIGGEELNPGDRPFLVSLGIDYPDGYSHVCGATLVAPRVVLSAAHCIILQFDMLVKINKFKLDDDTGAISYELCDREYGYGCNTDKKAYVIIHPYWSPETLNDDFALIFLPSNVEDVNPVKLNSDPYLLADSDSLQTFGWGYISKDPEVKPNVPHIVTLQYIPNDLCASQEYWGEENELEAPQITSNMLCAYNSGKSGCQGDSGGPIVVDTPDGSVQVGITSWGHPDCAVLDRPSVYARVSAGIEWINSTVCGEIGEWCSENEDGDYCFELEHEGASHVALGTNDDGLPGFINEMIESGAIVAATAHASEWASPKKKESMNLSANNPVSIVSGEEASKGSHPYLVAMGAEALEDFRPGGYACSGTLIAPDVVLSAAHCFTDQYGNKVKLDWIDLNRHDLSSDPGVMRVYLEKSDIWRHNHYNYMTGENDMALIFLPMKVDIEPVMLNSYPDIPGYPGAPMDVSGWGRTSEDGYFPHRSRTATVEYLPNADCMTSGYDITPGMMCATSEERRGPCTGDSGGPLVVETDDGHHLQVGITSADLCAPKAPMTPPCASGTKILTVELMTDNYPAETSWTLMNLCSEGLQIAVDPLTLYTESNTFYTNDYCVPDVELKFTIYDDYGDGISPGYYKVTYDGTEVASGGEFEQSESETFGNAGGECVPLRGVYSRVSSGMEWIERAMECRSNDSPGGGKSGKSSKSGKTRKMEAS